MVPDISISVILNWLLLLALFPMAFFWLRRAWRIFIKKNYSEVALKRGLPPSNPKKWAPVVGIVNLVCGGVAVWIIIAVLVLARYPFETWNAYAGMTIWGKIFGDLIIRFTAHPITLGRKKETTPK